MRSSGTTPVKAGADPLLSLEHSGFPLCFFYIFYILNYFYLSIDFIIIVM